ncbi:MAG: tetraacyldisaccharide 4'-kinase [Armatimonadetes bacterium]|nr:tetraacyldisaccharide 4'-kinase [Armatimonadota bacterium]MDE2207734.1 tetraacyldisaccharide 4'-kinase [Armatimonadota bacterium]
MADRLNRILNAPHAPLPLRLARVSLAALAHLHHAVLLLWMMPFAIGLRPRHRLARPVVSVGNLTSGGTGKTPFTILVCRAAQRLGAKPAVLIRGYRGKFEHGCEVVSDGEHVLLSPTEAGDEAVLLALELPGVPVLVGRDRRKTGAMAIREFDPDLLVLDDGMQFLQLHRDLDIALLDLARPFDNGWMLPRGMLREPPSHLRRVDAVVLTCSPGAGACTDATTEADVRVHAPSATLLHAFVSAHQLRRLNHGADADVSGMSGRKAVLVSAIAQPERFHALARALGMDVVFVEHHADHNPISAEQWQQVCSKAMRAGADMVVTTAKDAVKARSLPPDPPIYSLDIRLQAQEALELDRMLQCLLSRGNAAFANAPLPADVGEAH